MNEEIFIALQPHLGDVLQLLLLHNLTHAETFAEVLCNETGRKFTADDVKDMTEGRILIDHSMFQIICRLFHRTEIELLKITQNIQVDSEKPVEQMQREFEADIDYDEWKSDQESS